MIAILLVNRAAASEKPPSNVLVIPSTHKRLAGNSHYNYADLYSLVAASKPDLVGVEIRQEDLTRSDTYLHHNYPEEMIKLARSYKGRVFGFDWLGEELEGRAIPDDWWSKRSPIKKLERACASAPTGMSPQMMQLNSRLDALSHKQDEIIETATAESLADGRYDQVTADYYKIGAELTRGTPCQQIPEWYAERDNKISANIVREVLQNPGRNIAVVTGADHHGPVVAALSKLGPRVVVTPVSGYKR